MTIDKATKSRLDWIDYAKGVGIIFVVFGHVIKGLNTANLIDSKFYYYAVNFVYSFHMPLFFILSGYFFYSSLKKRGNKSFIFNKLGTIAYPFLIWSILQTIIEVKASGYINSPRSLWLSLDFLYKPKDQFWFLFALFFINVIGLLAFNFSKKWGMLLLFLIWAIGYSTNLQTGIFGKTFVNLIYFAVGIALFKYQYITEQILKSRMFILNAIIFCISIYFYFTFPHNLWYNEIFPPLAGSFTIFYLSNVCANKNGFKFLEYLGINSIVIYLVHIIASSGTRIILVKAFHITNPSVHIVLGTLTGLIVPLLFYNVAKKTKYLSWLFVFPIKQKPKNLAPSTYTPTTARFT
jgi:fucose 4-O-acetylase-like acetyltransferase